MGTTRASYLSKREGTSPVVSLDDAGVAGRVPRTTRPPRDEMTSTAAPPIADPFFAEHHKGEPDEQVRRWRKRFAALVLAGVVMWAVVAFVIGPIVVRGGYANTSSIGAINRAFDHREEHPVDFYLHKWNKLALAGLGAWIGLGALEGGGVSHW